MNKNFKPKYIYNRVMKDDPEFESVDSFLKEVSSNLVDGNYQSIKGYSNYSSSVTAIIISNEINYKKEIAYQVETKIKDASEIHIRERGYHRFVDFTIQATPINDDIILVTNGDEEIFKLRNSHEQFQEIENVSFVMPKLKCEEIMVNIVFDICEEFRIEPFTFHIHEIICHPIDTKPIHIYEAILKVFSQILGIESSVLKEKIEEKLSSYDFLYSEMEPDSLEFIRSNGKENYVGMRMVAGENYISPNAISQKTIRTDTSVAKKLKELFRKTITSDIAALCAPIYRDAMLFRNKEKEIVGYFNICFECLKIESHNRTYMPISMELMDYLDWIIIQDDLND